MTAIELNMTNLSLHVGLQGIEVGVVYAYEAYEAK
jgi:hypothetical protein